MTGPHVHCPFEKIGEHLAFMQRHRLNLEIYFSASALDQVAPRALEDLRAGLDYGPGLSIHAPFMDLSPGAVDAQVREVTLRRFNQVLDVASILSPAVVVFHSGFEKWKYALNISLWLEKSMTVWPGIVERAAAQGAKVAIENVFEDTPENLRLLAERIDSPWFGLCFDSGHFNLFSRVSLDEWIGQTGRYIAELHLHDNDGSRDAHLPPGEGTFDFGSLFDLLRGRSDLVFTVEAHSEAEVLKSFAALKKLLTIQEYFY